MGNWGLLSADLTRICYQNWKD